MSYTQTSLRVEDIGGKYVNKNILSMLLLLLLLLLLQRGFPIRQHRLPK
jgi:hypothetical protein